jgi:hypothetical protein
LQQSEQVVGKHIGRGVLIEMDERPVGERDLNASALGANPIALKQRHIDHGRLGAAFALKRDSPFDN